MAIWDSARIWRVSEELAEREGFEPPIPVKVYTLSRRAPSATRPSLRAHYFRFYFIREAGGFGFRGQLSELSPAQPPHPSRVCVCDWVHHPCHFRVCNLRPRWYECRCVRVGP